MIVTAPRAAAILYHLLSSRPDRRPFLLPANICPVVPLAFLKANMPFVFLDIDPLTLNLDLAHAATQLRSGEYGGILYAHTYGEPSTPVDFFTTVKHLDPNLLVIDDRCLNMPDSEPEPKNPADVVLYSTGYAKMMDLGSGGYAFLGSGILYHPQTLPFNPAHLDQVEKDYKTSIAHRTRFRYSDTDWLQTDPVPEWEEYQKRLSDPGSRSLARRMEINAVYASRLPAEICLPQKFQSWRFNIRLKDKAKVLKNIFDAGLFASSHYASLAGIFTPGSCPQADALAGSVVNLFNDHYYSVEKAERTCDIILQEAL
jgi:hypothetical protein